MKKPSKPDKPKMGTPSPYTDETRSEICRLLAEGNSLVSICKMKGFPEYSVAIRWLNDPRYEDFRKNYARAREEQAHVLAAQALEIADNPDEDVQRSRLRWDARRWYAGKLLPKVYGDRTTIAGDQESPLIPAQTLDPVEVARRVAFALARGKAKIEGGST